MNVRRPARALALASLLLLPLASRAQQVVTLTGGEWLPYISQTLPHYGPIARIVTEAFALEGVRVNYTFRPWSRAFAEAANGLANGTLVWSVSDDDSERARRFLRSDVVFHSQSVFFHLKSYPFRWRGGQSLADMRIGGTAGYEYQFDKATQSRMDLSAPTDTLNFHKLLAGRFDVFPANLDVGLWIMRTELSPDKAGLIAWDPRPYHVAHYHLLLNKRNPDNERYLALFNRGLKRLRASGKYEQYLRGLSPVPKWPGSDGAMKKAPSAP